MAKNNSNNSDLPISQIEILANKLEKTNSSLGEKVGEVIKAQALFKSAETELKTISVANQQQTNQLIENVALLSQKLAAVESKTNQLKQIIETVNNNINIKINELTQSTTNVIARQDSVEKQLKTTSEQITLYNQEHSKDKVLYLVAFMVLFLALGYRCCTLDKQVAAITEQLENISEKLPQTPENKKPESANPPTPKPTSEKKTSGKK